MRIPTLPGTPVHVRHNISVYRGRGGSETYVRFAHGNNRFGVLRTSLYFHAVYSQSGLRRRTK